MQMHPEQTPSCPQPLCLYVGSEHQQKVQLTVDYIYMVITNTNHQGEKADESTYVKPKSLFVLWGEKAL